MKGDFSRNSFDRKQDSSEESEKNQLLVSLEAIRQTLYRYLSPSLEEMPTTSLRNHLMMPINDDTDNNQAFMRLNKNFGLSHFERQLLLLCLGVEVCHEFGELCAQIHGDSACRYPTFSLAAALFPNEAHWQALSPNAPLRYWRLIACEKTTPLTTCRLWINERTMQHLLGMESQEESLMPFLHQISMPLPAIPSHEALAKRMFSHWQQLKNSCDFKPIHLTGSFDKKNEFLEEAFVSTHHFSLPCLHLSGSDRLDLQQVALRACQERQGSTLYQINANALPKNPKEWEELKRLLIREVLFTDCVYWVYDEQSSEHSQDLLTGLEQLAGSLPLNCILAGAAPPAWLKIPCLNLEVARPTRQEQLALWKTTLTKHTPVESSTLETLVQHFNLSSSQIQQAPWLCDLTQPCTEKTWWQYSRHQLRQSLDGLARIIEPKATWQDLVLPESISQLLRQMLQQIKQRHLVHQAWGFEEKNHRGLGLCALFSGQSGTGKTLAAEIIANELSVDLYHIDLSMVMSRYIGETEKHLKKIFDSAQACGAILLFDEADALFGKRTEIKDSHDRYANIGVNYLLQRMESYQGLSILTTNYKKALDEAFLRRIRFVVSFPFPDLTQREQIWKKIFPPSAPIENLNFEKLSRLNISGGHIYHIALNAAFLAAEKNKSITMQEILEATRHEYLKLEQPFPESE